MNTKNRDLLILLNQDVLSAKAIEHEVEFLHEILYKIESIENLCIAHEIIDLNRYRIISNISRLKDFFRSKENKAFTFLNNKN